MKRTRNNEKNIFKQPRRSLGGAPGPSLLGPHPTDPAPDLPDRLNLGFDVREHGSIPGALQTLIDEGPEHHLEAHRPLESTRRLASEDSSAIQNRLGNREQNSGLVLEHRSPQGR